MKTGFASVPITTLVTGEQPLYAVALSNHRLWVEHRERKTEKGFACAVYYEPYSNLIYRHTLDAIFIEVLGAADKGYHVAGFATLPDAERREIRLEEWHGCFKTAKKSAWRWLLAARRTVGL